jgi:hypothetical protein
MINVNMDFNVNLMSNLKMKCNGCDKCKHGYPCNLTTKIKDILSFLKKCNLCDIRGHEAYQHKCTLCNIYGDHIIENCPKFCKFCKDSNIIPHTTVQHYDRICSQFHETYRNYFGECIYCIEPERRTDVYKEFINYNIVNTSMTYNCIYCDSEFFKMYMNEHIDKDHVCIWCCSRVTHKYVQCDKKCDVCIANGEQILYHQPNNHVCKLCNTTGIHLYKKCKKYCEYCKEENNYFRYGDNIINPSKFCRPHTTEQHNSRFCFYDHANDIKYGICNYCLDDNNRKKLNYWELLYRNGLMT